MDQRRVIRPSPKLLVKYYVYLLLAILIFVLPAEFLGFVPDFGWTFVLIYSLVNILWIVPLAILLPFYLRSIEYEMGADAIVVRRGVITKSETTVPYRTVTNIDIKRGPLDRLLGLGGLKVHTAGYSQQAGAEATLTGLAEYAALHDALRQALRQYRARTGAAVGVEEPAQGASAGGSAEELLRELLAEVRAVRKHLEGR